jgi:hypothetical protein
MRNQPGSKRPASGATLVEGMFGIVRGSVLRAMTGSYWLWGNRSLAIKGHYAKREAKGRDALDSVPTVN